MHNQALVEDMLAIPEVKQWAWGRGEGGGLPANPSLLPPFLQSAERKELKQSPEFPRIRVPRTFSRHPPTHLSCFVFYLLVFCWQPQTPHYSSFSPSLLAAGFHPLTSSNNIYSYFFYPNAITAPFSTQERPVSNAWGVTLLH